MLQSAPVGLIVLAASLLVILVLQQLPEVKG